MPFEDVQEREPMGQEMDRHLSTRGFAFPRLIVGWEAPQGRRDRTEAVTLYEIVRNWGLDAKPR